MQPGSTTTTLIGRQSSSMPRLMIAAIIRLAWLSLIDIKSSRSEATLEHEPEKWEHAPVEIVIIIARDSHDASNQHSPEFSGGFDRPHAAGARRPADLQPHELRG